MKILPKTQTQSSVGRLLEQLKRQQKKGRRSVMSLPVSVPKKGISGAEADASTEAIFKSWAVRDSIF